MLKTHTGKPITLDYLRRFVTCGAWSVAERDIYEERPGRARQMRRMVAKARRRERRERREAQQGNAPAHLTMNEIRVANGLPPLDGWHICVDLARDAPPCPSTVEYGADALELWRRIPKSPVYTIGVDLAHEAPPIVITVPPGDYSEPFVLPEGATLPETEDEP